MTQNTQTVLGPWSTREFADLFSVTPRTLRFYEDKGLLSPARENGARIFTVKDYNRVEKILRGKRLGFSLDDIGEVFEVADGQIHDRTELVRRKNNFQTVINSLERRRQDLKKIASDMNALCRDIEKFLETAPESGETTSVFAHSVSANAAAYEAAFAKTLNGGADGDDDYNLGYPAHASA